MEEKNFMLKLGNLYIERVSVDGYDSEINVAFTNDISSAHNFKEDNAVLIKNILESFLQSTFVIIIKENNDNND